MKAQTKHSYPQQTTHAYAPDGRGYCQQCGCAQGNDIHSHQGQPTGGAESAPEAQATPVPFTPGPWRVQGRFVGSQGPTICDCFVSALVRKDEAAANAKLISACPELLEALQEAVACNRNAHPEPYWMQAARAAISKATQP